MEGSILLEVFVYVFINSDPNLTQALTLTGTPKLAQTLTLTQTLT